MAITTPVHANWNPNITPNNNFPGANLLQDAGGWVMWAGLTLAVIGLIVGVVILVLSKQSSNQRMQGVGTAAILWCCLGAVIIGSAVFLIQFSSEQSLEVAPAVAMIAGI